MVDGNIGISLDEFITKRRPRPKREQTVVKINLMYKDIQVAEFDLELTFHSEWIRNVVVLNEQLFPQVIRDKKIGLHNWLINRCLLMNSHRNIFLAMFAGVSDGRLSKFPALQLSLLSNSVSVVDKYWLNPIETIEIEHYNHRFIFEHTSWDDIDPFRNKFVSNELNRYALCDRCLRGLEPEIDARSLNWATDGDEAKRWVLVDGTYWMEKRMVEERLQLEIRTLNFFKDKGIKTPEYSCCYSLIDKTDKIHYAHFIDGYSYIKKSCLTDRFTHLDMVCNHIDGDTDVVVPLRRMCAAHNVSEEMTTKFVNAVCDYQNRFQLCNVLIDACNFGLLVHENGTAEPVVWAGLEIKQHTFFPFRTDGKVWNEKTRNWDRISDENN